MIKVGYALCTLFSHHFVLSFSWELGVSGKLKRPIARVLDSMGDNKPSFPSCSVVHDIKILLRNPIKFKESSGQGT